MNKDMRVAVTKRMLQEGMLRCLEKNTISKITVTDLCRESGINRATFYNHYDTPIMILKEIANEYAEKLLAIYSSHHTYRDRDDKAALEECLIYISERKAELKTLFSGNTESFLSGVVMEIISEKVAQSIFSSRKYDHDEYLLRAASVAAAIYGVIQIWITMDINKTPKELVAILKNVIQGDVFLR